MKTHAPVVHRRWQWAKTGAVLCAIVVTVWHAAMLLDIAFTALTYEYENFQWGEWGMCFQSWQLAQGRNPFPLGSTDRMTAMPYTPLMAVLTAPLLRLTGPRIEVGRAVSLLCFGFILLWVFMLARRERHLPRPWAFFAVLTCIMVVPLTEFSLHKYHPNSLAICLGMAGVLVFSRNPGSIIRTIAAFALALAAFYAKQTAIVFFIALAMLTFFENRPRAFLMSGGTIAAGGLLWLAGNRITSGGLSFYCFHLPSSFPLLPGKLDDGVRYVVQNGWFYVVPAIVAATRGEHWRSPSLVLAYIALPASLGAYALDGGTFTNFAFVLVPLCVPAAAGWRRIVAGDESPARTVRWALLAAALLVQPLLPRTRWPRPTTRDSAIARELRRLIGATSGDVLALVNGQQQFLAGKGWQTSADAMWELYHAGIDRFPEIERKVRGRVYDKVILSKLKYDGGDTFAATVLWRLLRNNYCVEATVRSGHVHHPAYVLQPCSGQKEHGGTVQQTGGRQTRGGTGQGPASLAGE